jgi:hypothetical protein
MLIDRQGEGIHPVVRILEHAANCLDLLEDPAFWLARRGC